MAHALDPVTCSDEPIWQVFTSAFHTPALVLSDKLGLFAALDAAPATAVDLAPRLGVEVRAVETLVGVMAALGFLTRAGERFHLTEVSRTYLVPGRPYYWGGMLRRIFDNPLDCNKLLAALRQGKASADARVTALWEAPIPPPAALVAFTHAMHAHSFALAMRAVPRLGLEETTRLLDVAGGSGSYSIAACHHFARLTATVLDLSPVCPVTAEYAAQYEGGGRVHTVAANMFVDPWPVDHDHALFCDIFHDWDDERCLSLAKRAREAIRSGGRVTVHEMVLSETKDGPLTAISYSMAMLFSTQGRQRSASELIAILDAAGLRDVSATPTSGGYVAVHGVVP